MKDIYKKVKGNHLSGFVVISIGLLIVVPSANLDMANHLLNRPETFFSPSHGGVYSGVAIVIFGSIWVLRNAYRQQENQSNNPDRRRSNLLEYFKLHRYFFPSDPLPLSIKLIFYGVIIITLAGPFDLAWHTAFGLDGLLSPSHATLRIGEALCGIGALLEIISANPIKDSRTLSKNSYKLYPILIIIATLPVLYAARGFISMVTLPFSNTYNFHWNLDPISAAIIATVGYPFFNSLMLYLTFRLGNFNATGISYEKGSKSEITRPTFRFGILTLAGITLMTTTIFTVILPNIYLSPTIPLYILNIIPIVSADILLTIGYSGTFNGKLSRKTAEITAGAIIGLSFFALQYPLIAYTYNEVLENPYIVGSTNLHIVYLKTLDIVPFIVIPSIVFGIIGVMVGKSLLSHYAPQQLIRPK